MLHRFLLALGLSALLAQASFAEGRHVVKGWRVPPEVLQQLKDDSPHIRVQASRICDGVEPLDTLHLTQTTAEASDVPGILDLPDDAVAYRAAFNDIGGLTTDPQSARYPDSTVELKNHFPSYEYRCSPESVVPGIISAWNAYRKNPDPLKLKAAQSADEIHPIENNTGFLYRFGARPIDAVVAWEELWKVIADGAPPRRFIDSRSSAGKILYWEWWRGDQSYALVLIDSRKNGWMIRSYASIR